MEGHKRKNHKHKSPRRELIIEIVDASRAIIDRSYTSTSCSISHKKDGYVKCKRFRHRDDPDRDIAHFVWKKWDKYQIEKKGAKSKKDKQVKKDKRVKKDRQVKEPQEG